MLQENNRVGARGGPGPLPRGSPAARGQWIMCLCPTETQKGFLKQEPLSRTRLAWGPPADV